MPISAICTQRLPTSERWRLMIQNSQLCLCFPIHSVQLCLDHGNANVKISVKGRGRDLNFSDPNAVMQLTKTLLKVDFDLSIELPEDRLCPPVSDMSVSKLRFAATL